MPKKIEMPQKTANPSPGPSPIHVPRGDDDMKQSPSDGVLRAMTDDRAFRVMVTHTTQLARDVAAIQQRPAGTTLALSELLTAAVLVRETMSPSQRVQLLLVHTNGRHQLVADSLPDGSARGVVLGTPPEEAADAWNMLQVMRTMPRGNVHKSAVRLDEGGDVSRALMRYMQDSEQVVSVAAVGCIMNGDEIVRAGGYVVQLLPEVTDPPLKAMTERLAQWQSPSTFLDANLRTPQEVLLRMLETHPFTMLDSSEVRFGCHCNQARIMASLASLGRTEIQSMVDEGNTIELSCNHCGKAYHVAPSGLRGILLES